MRKSSLRLPAPSNPYEQYEFLPIVRIGRVVPFGYRQDPEDEDILLPIKEELELLEEAKVHLKRYSYRQVANWLSEQSGRYISHTGLRDRIKIEQKRAREASIQRQLAERLKKAIEKAEKIEKNRTGAVRINTGAS